MLCIVECAVRTLNYPAAGTALCGSFRIGVFVAAGISPYSRIRGLGRCAMFLVGRKCRLFSRLWHCLLFWPFNYVPATVPQTSSGGTSWKERIYIPSLRLKLIPICTQLSQPTFFKIAARQVHGLPGVWVCCVLFFVVDKLGIFSTILVRRG